MLAPAILFRPHLYSHLLCLLLPVCFATPSLAQNGFNPFWKDQFNSKSTPKQKNSAPPTAPAQAQKPYLEPMQRRPDFQDSDASNVQTRDGQDWQQQFPKARSAQPGYDGRSVESAPLGELDRGVDSNSLEPVMATPGRRWRCRATL